MRRLSGNVMLSYVCIYSPVLLVTFREAEIAGRYAHFRTDAQPLLVLAGVFGIDRVHP
jgi:hypothetical protein